MLTSGDVVLLNFGVPEGHEVGFPRPAVIVTASDILAEGARVVQVVPLTSTIRDYSTEVVVPVDPSNGLEVDSAAQCQQIRSVSVMRIGTTIGSISSVQLRQIREVLALLFDL